MSSEARILRLMQAAYEASKKAMPPLDWKPNQQRGRMLNIPIACDCGTADIVGVSMIGIAWSDEPDTRVSFQLKVDIDGTEFRVARIDWRPRQPHTNVLGPRHLRGLTAYTSIHDFTENADLGLELMQTKNLPIVKKIDPDPADFKHLLAYLRDTFHLSNALEIPVPPWSQQLAF